MPTTRELRAQAKARKIKKYYSLNKAQLLQSLGLKDDLKSHKLSKGKGDAIAAQSQKLSKGNTTDRAVIKGRLKRAIARDLRSAGEGLTQEQKREIALKAIKREVKQIKRGTKELRGGSVRKAGKELTPAQRQRAKNLSEKSRTEKGMSERKKSRIPVSAAETMSVRDRREKLRRQFDPAGDGKAATNKGRKYARMAEAEARNAEAVPAAQRADEMKAKREAKSAGGEWSQKLKALESLGSGKAEKPKNQPMDLAIAASKGKVSPEKWMKAKEFTPQTMKAILESGDSESRYPMGKDGSTVRMSKWENREWGDYHGLRTKAVKPDDYARKYDFADAPPAKTKAQKAPTSEQRSRKQPEPEGVNYKEVVGTRKAFDKLKQDPKAKRWIELSLGAKMSDRKMTQALGLTQEEALKLSIRVRKELGIDPRGSTKEQLKAKLGSAYGSGTEPERALNSAPDKTKVQKAPTIELENVKTAADRAAYSAQEAKAAKAGGRASDAKAWEKEAKNAQKVALNKAIGKQKPRETPQEKAYRAMQSRKHTGRSVD